MLPFFLLALSTIVMSFYAYVVFGGLSDNTKMAIGLGCAVTSNLLYLTLCRTMGAGPRLLLWSMIWDGAILLAFSLVPIVMIGKDMTTLSKIGIGVAVAGLIMTKIGFSEGL